MYRTYYEDSGDLETTFSIYSCDKDDKPEYTTHWSMQKIGKVRFSFTDEEMKTGKSKVLKGRKLFRLDFDIEVDLFSERGDLQFNTLVNGQKKDKAIIQFEQKFDGKESG